MSYLLCYFFFFFKQKTAYEMRISDWSSDVCSSDLARREWRALRARHCPWLRRQRYDNPLTHSSVQNSIETLVRLSSGTGRSACGRTAHPPLACPRRYCGEREIGRASCRKRVCLYVYILVVAVSLHTTTLMNLHRALMNSSSFDEQLL